MLHLSKSSRTFAFCRGQRDRGQWGMDRALGRERRGEGDDLANGKGSAGPVALALEQGRQVASRGLGRCQWACSSALSRTELEAAESDMGMEPVVGRGVSGLPGGRDDGFLEILQGFQVIADESCPENPGAPWGRERAKPLQLKPETAIAGKALGDRLAEGDEVNLVHIAEEGECQVKLFRLDPSQTGQVGADPLPELAKRGDPELGNLHGDECAGLARHQETIDSKIDQVR